MMLGIVFPCPADEAIMERDEKAEDDLGRVTREVRRKAGDTAPSSLEEILP
jgi:hypothetical protein